MNDDLISRRAAQEAILNCEAIMFNPDKEIASKALESVPTVEEENFEKALDDLREAIIETFHLREIKTNILEFVARWFIHD